MQKITTKKSKVCFGVTNKTQDNCYIPFFDFDGEYFKQWNIIDMSNYFKSLQKNLHLSDIYIIKSTNGFNAFTLDKVSWKYLKLIMKDSIFVDKKFIELAEKRGFYVLRTGNDKNYFNTIKSNDETFIKSNAHRLFFNEMLDIDINGSSLYDELYKIELIAYRSEKNGIVDMENF